MTGDSTPTAGTRWWDPYEQVDGVFKGGGAKGILYAGALAACQERGVWFRSVAGTSAGAITATLIAAGLTPEEIGRCAAEAPSKVRRFWGGDLLGQPLLGTAHLRDWLEGILRGQVEIFGSPVEGRAVTFKDLKCTGIELFIVCVDVHLRQPRILSTTLTPDVSVVDSLLASSAIPFAFRQGRLELGATNQEVEVHRVIDGGVWANYPAFIYRDSSFREYHELSPVDLRNMLGFSIEPQAASLPRVTGIRTWRPGFRKDLGATTRVIPLPVWAFSRFYFFFLLPIIVIFAVVDLLRGRGMVTWREVAFALPGPFQSVMAFVDGFTTGGDLGRWVLYGLAVALFLLMLVSAILGYTLLDTGPSVFRTLMSVGTGVPYWTGCSPEDRVIRLRPPTGLSTFKFKMSPDEIRTNIESGRTQASEQLEKLVKRDGDDPTA